MKTVDYLCIGHFSDSCPRWMKNDDGDDDEDIVERKNMKTKKSQIRTMMLETNSSSSYESCSVASFSLIQSALRVLFARLHMAFG